jgi:hypothetical protein
LIEFSRSDENFPVLFKILITEFMDVPAELIGVLNKKKELNSLIKSDGREII